MTNEFGMTVDLRLKPSMRALRLIFILHIVCLGLLPFAMQPGPPMMVLLAAIGLSWLYVRRHAALGFAPRSINRIIWHVDGEWTLHPERGTPVDAELLPGSLVHAWLLILRFRLKPDGAVATRLILGDEAEPESLRRLRARLSVASG